MNLSDAERARLQQQYPRAGYWFGMLPTHPVIHGPPINGPHQPQPAQPIQQQAPFQIPVGPDNQQHYRRNYEIQHPAQLPPPYPPPPPHSDVQGLRGVPQVPAPVQAPPSAAVPVTFSLPLNTNVVGGIVTRVTLSLPSDLPFQDFFSRICAHMDLSPSSAILGYKMTGDLVRTAPYRLMDEEDLRNAMSKAVLKIQRARTREIIVEIHNLRPAQVAAQAKQAAHAGRKPGAGSAGVSDASEPSTSVSFAPQLRRLRAHLACQRHGGKPCYVDRITAEHKVLSVFDLTLWAKSMLLDPINVTLTRPPSTLQFDHFRIHKRRANREQNPQPQIHFHLNGIKPASSRARRPFSAKNSDPVIDLTGSDTESLDEPDQVKAEVKVEADGKENWQF
ncbi:hypothetical protein CVT24_011467 [Panaeolus cyanescens]|uniref:Uncharacterized protein n=1 Tax=Panaeolus cyanescens TaxID=181874 RepID=A0A409YGU5_9AGAR|nr:hypothetical protein CVT24_011467 [Panaeolus cyanescens]